MAAPMNGVFEEWLSEKLVAVNPEVDLEVFVSYIISILETESAEEDQKESLVEFLAEITQDDVELCCEQIIKKWQAQSGTERSDNEKDKESVPVIDKLHSIIQKQQSQKIATRELTAEEKARKNAILAQYGHVSDGEVTDEEDDLGAAGNLSKNINALSVAEREQELRERMKQEHELKKQKDKEDREKQKQKAAERKAAEKKRTQKGERRR